MRTHRKPVLFVILTALLAAVLGACSNPALPPVFYTLATEQDVRDDRGLEDDLAAIKMVGTGSRYFLAAGSLFTRLPGDGEQWSRVPPPAEGALCTTIEVYDGKLWAGWYRTLDGAGLGLWTLDLVPDPGSWTTGDWLPEANGGLTGAAVHIGLLQAFAGPNVMLVGVRSSGSHLLHSYNAGAWAGTSDTLAAAVVDADFDGTNYWVVAGTDLYSGAPGTLALQDIAGLTDTGARFGGVLYQGGDLYLSTKGGRLLRYEDLAGTPAPSSSGDPLTVGGTTVRFTLFVDATVTTGGRIYVGTESFGFYELTAGGLSPLTRRPDYNISRLYNGAVNSFFLDDGGTPADPSDDILFVCVSGAGLWRGENYAEPSWTWKQE